MAGNTFLTPDIIAKEALMVLRNNAVMANLVHRDYSDEFVEGVGDTITIRKPAKFVAKEYAGSIDVQDATESGVAVKMDKHLDVSFAVTSKQMSLDIKDFSKQLLVPAMQAFADKVDGYLLGLASDITNEVGYTSGTDNIRTKLVDARKYLTVAAAPMTDRRFVYGSDIEADLLKTDMFLTADKVGDQGTALREASLGRKFGLDFYVDQNVETDNLVFHKNAFALVTRPLALPLGNKNAAIVNYDGFGLRVVYGYDMDKKTDTISIDMLCGVKTLDKDLAAVLDSNPNQPLTLQSDLAGATYPWTDKTPADFQSDVAVADGKITGTLTFIEGGLSPDGPLAGDGYFLALKWGNPPADTTSLKVGLVPSASGMDLIECLADTDRNGVFKITDKDNQVFVIEYTKGGVVQHRAYDLSGLVLAAEG